MPNPAGKALLLLLLLVVLGGPLSSDRQSPSEPRHGAPHRKSEHQAEVVSGSPRPAPNEEVEQGEKYDPDCANAQEHDDADFCRQRRAADAAQEASLWAGRQFWLSLAATAALIPTLILSVVATFMSVAAARHAEEANRISREAYVADQRPWLSIGELTVGKTCMTPSPADGVHCAVRFELGIRIRNSGRTPALRVRLRPRVTHFFGSGAYGTAELQARVDSMKAATRDGDAGPGIAIAPGDPPTRRSRNVDLPVDPPLPPGRTRSWR